MYLHLLIHIYFHRKIAKRISHTIYQKRTINKQDDLLDPQYGNTFIHLSITFIVYIYLRIVII